MPTPRILLSTFGACARLSADGVQQPRFTRDA